MATIKSFTSLEQSKKLAEILPIESADGFYEAQINPFTNKWEDILFVGNEWASDEVVIPAWSLAALLGVIPQEIFDSRYIINITEGCDEKWVITYDYIDNKSHSFYGLSSGASNLVDACIELIYKLHERKLL